MTNDEKIALITEEIKQAKTMVEFSRKGLNEWLNKLILREDHLQKLESYNVKQEAPKSVNKKCRIK